MSAGDSSRWQARLVSAYELIHAGVLSVWPACRDAAHSQDQSIQPVKRNRRSARTKAARRRLEDPITRNLVRRLKLVPQLRGRFHVVSQLEIINECIDNDPDPLGYIDIAILFFIDEDEACLALECKRLNVNGASLAGKYVADGMMRFVSGKYVPAAPVGGMIGYVMDGRVENPSLAVIEQIRSSLAELRCAESSIVFLSKPDYFSTTHARELMGIELKHHLLSVT